MNKHLKAALIVGGIAMLLLAGTLAYQQKKELAAQAEKPKSLAINDPMPDFEAKSLKGVDLKLSQYQNKIVILNFWASWCGPCVEEMPSLIKLMKALPNDVVLLAISGDSNKEDIDAFLKSFPELGTLANIHIIWDSNKALSQQYQVYRLPESFVVDKTQKMVKKISGTIDWYNEDALNYMKTLGGEAQK